MLNFMGSSEIDIYFLEAYDFVILTLSLTILTKMTLGSITNDLQVIYFRNYL